MATAAHAALPAEAIDVLANAQQKREARRIVDEAHAAMREQLDRGIVLGGRRWMPIRAVTFELERIRFDVMRRAGIAGLFHDLQRAGDDSDAQTMLVLNTAFANGALFELLAHLLVEADTDYLPWDPTRATQRALSFASLVAPEDHQTIEANILMLVLDFFLRASASMPISLKSLVIDGMRSARATEIDPTDRLPNTPLVADDSPSAATSTLADGTPSSAPSADSEASIP